MENLLLIFTKKNPSEFRVEQRVKSSEQRAKGNEQRAKSNEQQAKNNEQRAKSNEQRAQSLVWEKEAKANINSVERKSMKLRR